MSLVELRMEVERELRAATGTNGIQGGTSDISDMLRQLKPHAALQEGIPELEAALRVMNGAAHGIPVEPQAAEKALATGRHLIE